MPQVRIGPGFWAGRQEVNARQAIHHQWEQLEASGCIENFRLAAGEAEGFRSGLFFADSDAYKWLEAAARTWAGSHDPRLEQLMEAFVDLIGRAQMPDGYLFTYNQLHFPGKRWHNLQVEHELYCHGHLIEAGVSHYQATGRSNLLDLARRAADRICADFAGRGPEYTCGHEEIEIALLRLHEVTPGDEAYLAMARDFIDRRGHTPRFGWLILRQYLDTLRRMRQVERHGRAYRASHPQARRFTLPPGNPAKHSPVTFLRWILSNLEGKYNQQHAPFARQAVPIGHAVRFAYLETAAAKLVRQDGDRSRLPVLEQAWDRMVRRRMYLTGGIGALPGLEGFGKDDELDPEVAYAETCAALGSLFWNWEMAQLTGEARYSDLFEWQLYNAVLVGMGLEGREYLYNNPLGSRGSVTRRAWYTVPCCPSNLSRTLADLGSYVCTAEQGGVALHQYISSDMQADPDSTPTLRLTMDSGLPWQGRVRLTVTGLPGPEAPAPWIRLRRPGWASQVSIRINGSEVTGVELESPASRAGREPGVEPAAAFDPTRAGFLELCRPWEAGDVLELEFDLPVCLRRAPRRVRGYRGRAALTRGPLVYCLESTDNPGVDLFSARLDPESIALQERPDLLGGCMVLGARTTAGQPLTFVPYFLWGNRGASRMTVWVRLPPVHR